MDMNLRNTYGIVVIQNGLEQTEVLQGGIFKGRK